MKKLKKTQYRCEVCKEVFDKGWSDEEAYAEFRKVHPGVPMEETGMICDYCFEKMAKWFLKQGIDIKTPRH